MRDEFEQATQANQSAFSLELTDGQIRRLTDYYQLVLEHNALLHLVAPCSADEFAVRHILESLMLLEHVPLNAKFADVGTGAGLPSIPCLIVRGDLSATLIESKVKKAKFLNEAIRASWSGQIALSSSIAIRRSGHWRLPVRHRAGAR
jgi:16S rRNA (guanine527-N7)-methyltransferase